eukprot:scaffold87830_cov36-Cyclotella_meneghiniana.AAC.2
MDDFIIGEGWCFTIQHHNTTINQWDKLRNQCNNRDELRKMRARDQQQNMQAQDKQQSTADIDASFLRFDNVSE